MFVCACVCCKLFEPLCSFAFYLFLIVVFLFLTILSLFLQNEKTHKGGNLLQGQTGSQVDKEIDRLTNGWMMVMSKETNGQRKKENKRRMIKLMDG